MAERIKTYISGFDDQMSGGIPEGHIVLLAGTPGSMKSSVAYNLLFHNAKEHGTHALYITLEQSRDSLLAHMAGLGFDQNAAADKLSVVDLGFLRKNVEATEEGKSVTEIFKMYAQRLKEKMEYKIVVVDSLPVLNMLSEEDRKTTNRRTELFRFFEWLRDLGVTTLLISEVTGVTDTNVKDENYLADGVIMILKERVGAISNQRRILIDKMRNCHHNGDYFILLFKDGQFQVTQSFDAAGGPPQF